MAYITTRKGWEELNNTLVDEETGMTQADLIEWEYDGDIEFIDEDQNSYRSSPSGERSLYPEDKCDDSDIRGTEALGCLYACVRALVRWRDDDDDDGVINVVYFTTTKLTKMFDNTKMICYTYNIRYK